MSASSFDPTLYLRPPRLVRDAFVTLVRQVLTASAGRATPAAHALVMNDLAAVEEALAARQIQAGMEPVRRREIDAEEDELWYATHDILLSKSRFAGRDRDDATRFYGLLFGDGRAFLMAAHEVQYQAVDLRLKLLLAEEPTAERLLGDELLQHLQDSHARYGQMLNIGAGNAAVTVEDAVVKATNALRASFRDFVLLVCAEVAFAPEKVADVEKALAPISAAREKARRASQGESAPEEPAPVVVEP
jgi:hypothetical protein